MLSFLVEVVPSGPTGHWVALSLPTALSRVSGSGCSSLPSFLNRVLREIQLYVMDLVVLFTSGGVIRTRKCPLHQSGQPSLQVLRAGELRTHFSRVGTSYLQPLCHVALQILTGPLPWPLLAAPFPCGISGRAHGPFFAPE